MLEKGYLQVPTRPTLSSGSRRVRLPLLNSTRIPSLTNHQSRLATQVPWDTHQNQLESSQYRDPFVSSGTVSPIRTGPSNQDIFPLQIHCRIDSQSAFKCDWCDWREAVYRPRELQTNIGVDPLLFRPSAPLNQIDF